MLIALLHSLDIQSVLLTLLGDMLGEGHLLSLEQYFGQISGTGAFALIRLQVPKNHTLGLLNRFE